MRGELLGRPVKIITKKDNNDFLITEASVPYAEMSRFLEFIVIIIFLRPFVESIIANPLDIFIDPNGNIVIIIFKWIYVAIIFHFILSLIIKRTVIFNNKSQEVDEKYNFLYKDKKIKYSEIKNITIDSVRYYSNAFPCALMYAVMISYDSKNRWQSNIYVNILDNHKNALIFAKKISSIINKSVNDITEQRK
jgi:hypothetical protein